MTNRTLVERTCILLALALLLSSCASGPRGWSEFFNPVRITWNDTSWCTPLRLKIALAKISKRFGPVTVHSTHRWPLENKRKGGKPKSYHLTCRAVDFSVPGNPAEVKRYLVSMREVGGYSHYPKGFYHIDTGPRRTW